MERGVGEDGCVAAALLGSGVQAVKNDLLAAMEVEQDSARGNISSSSAGLRGPRGRNIMRTMRC